MNPHDFIRAAGKLAAFARGDESLLRSAVSRAYYGSFHLALELLGSVGIDLPGNAGAHVRCSRLLTACGHSIAREIAGLLGDLHTDRIRADYRLSDEWFREFPLVRLRVERADHVARLIAECSQEPVRSEITSALRSSLAKDRDQRVREKLHASLEQAIEGDAIDQQDAGLSNHEREELHARLDFDFQTFIHAAKSDPDSEYDSWSEGLEEALFREWNHASDSNRGERS